MCKYLEHLAGLLQIEYEHETCYTESKNCLNMWDHFWAQYKTFHAHTQSAGVQLLIYLSTLFSSERPNPNIPKPNSDSGFGQIQNFIKGAIHKLRHPHFRIFWLPCNTELFGLIFLRFSRILTLFTVCKKRILQIVVSTQPAEFAFSYCIRREGTLWRFPRSVHFEI